MSLKLTVLRTARAAGVFALMRVLTRKYPRILCYHGGNLGDECLYNPKLFCTTGQLRQRLDWLRAKGFVPFTLDQLADGAALPAHGIPVALTLDDGWYSSYAGLLPLMAEYGYSPALYLHTEAYDAGAPIVPVTLRYLLWKAGARKVALDGFGAGMDGSWDLGERKQRERLLQGAEQWLRSEPPEALVSCLERFGAAIGIAPAELDLASRRFSYMTREELQRAAANGCRIELHGHVHTYAPGQPEQNRANIELCRTRISASGLPQARHYCYPSGSFDEHAPEVMRAAGVATATTCLPGLVDMRAPDARWFLPRFLDGGSVAMIEFEAEMSGFLALMRSLARHVRRPADAPRPRLA